ncbi:MULTISPECIES: hypothetical protein [Brucella/Ochrobactrum group]|jgi:hypothetical protein|uniref:Uncharacterized protein n=2 Tax=Brucella TaxID=234 RepID=A0A6N6QGU7_9HYPH|nr:MULTISPECIES: hypothetical protein [Brucella/Ochrobactrum group]QOD66181.1 hypothetical protein HGK82_14665 [Ochrobactrum sp. MT180101]QTN04243.1 hypothetical protein GTN27_13380 [Ochrobactrum sp. EEELCW01]AIK41264.1 hypothetical protein DR92_3952 [Brucella anthropi]EXL03578.1 repressor [Brucella anthropi]KAB2657789.1 hypothetical protein F9K94_06075 [Brucella tritici]
MFNTDPSNCGLLFFNKDRVGAGEPSQRETRDHQARPTHEQSNAPGNPHQPQPNDPQKNFDFDDPNGARPNDLANPGPRVMRRERSDRD